MLQEFANSPYTLGLLDLKLDNPAGTGTNAAPSSVGETAIDTIRSKGGTVTVEGGY